MDNEEHAAEFSVKHGNDAFVRKLLSRRSSFGEQSSRRGYFSEEPCGVPFTWEEQPGVPKDPPTLNFVPPIVPPPAAMPLQGPLRGSPEPAPAQSRSCFLKKPRRTHKPRRARMALQRHHAREFGLGRGHSESSTNSEDDLLSSKSSSPSSAADSSKGFALPSSGLRDLAKGLLKRFF